MSFVQSHESVCLDFFFSILAVQAESRKNLEEMRKKSDAAVEARLKTERANHSAELATVRSEVERLRAVVAERDDQLRSKEVSLENLRTQTQSELHAQEGGFIRHVSLFLLFLNTFRVFFDSSQS